MRSLEEADPDILELKLNQDVFYYLKGFDVSFLKRTLGWRKLRANNKQFYSSLGERSDPSPSHNGTKSGHGQVPGQVVS